MKKKDIIILYSEQRLLFVCLWVCSLSPPRSFDDLRQTWWVYVGGIALEGFFSKDQRVDGSTGHFRFPLYYIGPASHHTAATAPFAWQAAESNWRLLLWCMSTTYVGGSTGGIIWEVEGQGSSSKGVAYHTDSPTQVEDINREC